MNLNLCLAIKHHPMALWKTGLMNLIVAVVRSKTNSVKVLQKQPLCQRTLMPCVNWCCKFLMCHTDRGILGHFFHQHTFNIAWTPGRKKDLFLLHPEQFDNRSQEILQKYDAGASKDVYKIVTDDESWICAYDSGTNPMKVVCGKISSKQMVVCFFRKTSHVATIPLKHQKGVQKTYLGGVSIRVEKQTKMMVVHPNILSTVMLKMKNIPMEMSDCIW